MADQGKPRGRLRGMAGDIRSRRSVTRGGMAGGSSEATGKWRIVSQQWRWKQLRERGKRRFAGNLFFPLFRRFHKGWHVISASNPGPGMQNCAAISRIKRVAAIESEEQLTIPSGGQHGIRDRFALDCGNQTTVSIFTEPLYTCNGSSHRPPCVVFLRD